MAGFDPQKDKILGKWVSDETGLIISINQYENGAPKVQIGPRLVTLKDGSESQRKAGRLTMEDVLFLYDVIDEVKEKLAAVSRPQ